MNVRKPTKPPDAPSDGRPVASREAEETPDEGCPTRTYPTRFRLPEPARRREPIRYAR